MCWELCTADTQGRFLQGGLSEAMPSCRLASCGGGRAQLGADFPLSFLGNTFLIHETSKEVYRASLSAIFRLKLLGFGISWGWFNSAAEGSCEGKSARIGFGTDSNQSLLYTVNLLYAVLNEQILSLLKSLSSLVWMKQSQI